MNAKLILTEALVEVGEMLGTAIHRLYLDGHDDTRVDSLAPAATIALIYDVDPDQVLKDLEAIAEEKNTKLLAKQTGPETTDLAAIGHLADADRKG